MNVMALLYGVELSHFSWGKLSWKSWFGEALTDHCGNGFGGVPHEVDEHELLDALPPWHGDLAEGEKGCSCIVLLGGVELLLPLDVSGVGWLKHTSRGIFGERLGCVEW